MDLLQSQGICMYTRHVDTLQCHVHVCTCIYMYVVIYMYIQWDLLAVDILEMAQNVLTKEASSFQDVHYMYNGFYYIQG